MKRTLELDLDERRWRILDRLVAATEGTTSMDRFVEQLLDHVQQGVYRSGSWERPWLVQVVGSKAIDDAYEVEEDPLYRSREEHS